MTSRIKAFVNYNIYIGVSVPSPTGLTIGSAGERTSLTAIDDVGSPVTITTGTFFAITTSDPTNIHLSHGRGKVC